MGKAKRKAQKAANAALGVASAPRKGARKHIGANKVVHHSTVSLEAHATDRAAVAAPQPRKTASTWTNKEKPLIICARGITYRFRHLMTDLMQLVPHHKTDSKLDTKHDWNAINEVAELKGATSVLFFEARKRQDLYVWLSKLPDGPSVRFLCTNVHTMAELKLSGNHLKGARPVLCFDSAFDLQPHLQVMKELLQQVFVTPKGHQKSKPFFDHIISFTYCDNRIWLRNYQVVASFDKKKLKEEGVTLVEVGPRVTMQPVKVFAGSFRGKVIFENPEFINPNAVRAYEKRQAAGTYDSRVGKAAQRKEHREAHQAPVSPLHDRLVFAPVRSPKGDATLSPGATSEDDTEMMVDFGVDDADVDAVKALDA